LPADSRSAGTAALSPAAQVSTHAPLTGSARSVSVFVAAYNEAENLEPTVETLRRAFATTVDDYEIIVVDDGSTDGTDVIADRLAAADPAVRVIHNPGNKGLGYGWQRAIEAATRQSFVFVPGDNTWPYPSLYALFARLGQADIVTSYPVNPEIRPWGRRLVSSTFTLGLNLIFGLRLPYYHGLTVYPTAFLRDHAITTSGFASMSEALLRAIHQGFTFVSVPCVIEERASGESKALSGHNLKSVVGTIGSLFVDLRLRSRRGPASTLGLWAPAAPAALPEPAREGS
jgi:glycosyltransferase involved in cell wall biosynthesis